MLKEDCQNVTINRNKYSYSKLISEMTHYKTKGNGNVPGSH